MDSSSSSSSTSSSSSSTLDSDVEEDDEYSRYAPWFFERLQTLRLEEQLVDVTLCAEGREIPCHRVVLSASSDYFRAMFCGGHSETKKEKIEIGGVSAASLQQLVDFAYTSKVTITSTNVQRLFEAANMLQVIGVAIKCEERLECCINTEQCLGIWEMADKLSRISLCEEAKYFALKHFEDVWHTDRFLQLPYHLLKEYVSDDGLYAKDEEQVVEAILMWVRENVKERQRHVKELLESVRFSRVSQEYIDMFMKGDTALVGVHGMKKLIKNQSTDKRLRHILQGEIVLVGGVNISDRNVYDVNTNIDILDLDCHRTNNGPLPKPFGESRGIAACVLDNNIIVTGGDKSVCQAWSYAPSQDSWTKIGALKRGRYWHGMAVVQGQLYVVGGASYTYNTPRTLSVVEVYSKETNTWKKVAPLLEAVKRFGITACGGKVYVFGGEPHVRRETDAVQCYDPAQDEWTFGTALPKAMTQIAACTVNSKMYLAGGQLETVLCYDPQEDHYEELADRLGPWDHCSVTACGSEIFITGGQKCKLVTFEDIDMEVNKYTSLATVQCFNVSKGVMTFGAELPIAVHGHCTVTLPKYVTK